MKRWAVLTLVAAEALSYAGEIRYNWTGTATNVSDAHHILDGSVAAGGSIQGYLSFESTTPDSNSSPDQGDYAQRLPQAIEFRLGNYVIRCAGSTESYVLTMIDNSRDGDVIRAQGDSLISEPIANPAIGIGRISLTDASGAAFSGDHLPIAVPVLSQYNSKLIYLVVRNTTGYSAVVVGQLTSISEAGSGGSIQGNVELQE